MFGRQTLTFSGDVISGVAPFAVWEARPGALDLNDLRARLSDARVRFPRGGAIGFWSYEALRDLEPRAFPLARADDLGLPLARLVFYEKLKRRPFPAPAKPLASLEIVEVPDRADVRRFYCEGVGRIKEYIAAGDIYQANLTHRFQVENCRAPRTLARRLLRLNGAPAPRAALLEWDDFAILSDSPETFLTLRNRALEARPIKGTIRRGASSQDDDARKIELANSAKDRAENVMIVDLMRNDLGRVCEFGSVHVPQLFRIETFPTLHHGVSVVRGTLRKELDGLDAFVAAFPCGSITGAPKMRAMQILNELEPEPRGANMGALGYFGFDGLDGMERGDSHGNAGRRARPFSRRRRHRRRFGAGSGIRRDAPQGARAVERFGAEKIV